MNVYIKYFGRAGELAETESENLDLPENITSGEFKEILIQRKPALAELSFQLAVNHKLHTEEKLKDGDKLAVLPPFAGG